MTSITFNDVRRLLVTVAALGAFSHAGMVQAEADWTAFTMDNDTFVGNDNGYTNGIAFSWFDTPANDKPKPGLLARAMLWSLFGKERDAAFVFSAKTIGQTMVTPDDIEQDPPTLPPDDLPYAGMLYYNDNYVVSSKTQAEKIAVTIGVIGEYSFAEESQEFVHEIIDSDEPCCWDTQLDDEIVFQFSRGRVWKSWTSDSGRTDILLGTDIALGTMSSYVGASVMFRYGSGLERTFATALLATSRTANPIATDSGWYLFGGVRASYLANQIFLDGNTFDDDDDESVDYDETQVGLTAGLAYSWKNFSFTFAMNDINVNEDSDNESAEDYSEYGTFTLAWRLDQ